MQDVIRVTGFAIMAAAYAWFTQAETLNETTLPCLTGCFGLGVYFFGPMFLRAPRRKRRS